MHLAWKWNVFTLHSGSPSNPQFEPQFLVRTLPSLGEMWLWYWNQTNMWHVQTECALWSQDQTSILTLNMVKIQWSFSCCIHFNDTVQHVWKVSRQVKRFMIIIVWIYPGVKGAAPGADTFQKVIQAGNPPNQAYAPPIYKLCLIRLRKEWQHTYLCLVQHYYYFPRYFPPKYQGKGKEETTLRPNFVR